MEKNWYNLPINQEFALCKQWAQHYDWREVAHKKKKKGIWEQN